VEPKREDTFGWDASTTAPRRKRQPLPLPERLGERLTAAEVVGMLEEDGATDVTSFELPIDVFLGDSMIFATARTDAHLVVLADGLVGELKRRRLGDRSNLDGDGAGDGWAVVDTGNLMIHLLTAEARDRLQLESYWDPAKRHKREIYHADLDMMIPANMEIQPPPATARRRQKRLRRARRGGGFADADTSWFFKEKEQRE